MPDEVQQSFGFALYNARSACFTPMQSLSRGSARRGFWKLSRLARQCLPGGLHGRFAKSGLCLALLPEEIETWN